MSVNSYAVFTEYIARVDSYMFGFYTNLSFIIVYKIAQDYIYTQAVTVKRLVKDLTQFHVVGLECPITWQLRYVRVKQSGEVWRGKLLGSLSLIYSGNVV